MVWVAAFIVALIIAGLVIWFGERQNRRSERERKELERKTRDFFGLP